VLKAFAVQLVNNGAGIISSDQDAPIYDSQARGVLRTSTRSTLSLLLLLRPSV